MTKQNAWLCGLSPEGGRTAGAQACNMSAGGVMHIARVRTFM